MMSEIFGVIDTETNFSNQLISVGIVAVNATDYKIVDEYYGLFDPQYKSHAMYSHVLKYKGIEINNVAGSQEIIADLDGFIERNGIKKMFAYNAKFDYSHLSELNHLVWYDIMRLAAYRQHNSKITDEFECCKTGRLKSNFGVEAIYRLLSGDYYYSEVHNALTDARDEMQIMKMLGKNMEEYEVGRIN
ncbi:MAG: 3'-5' exoribonuclease [Lachnospiraceae bacterium]|nr:3'-5' exoribonuclease [Lachnospiraceae bacterium]